MINKALPGIRCKVVLKVFNHERAQRMSQSRTKNKYLIFMFLGAFVVNILSFKTGPFLIEFYYVGMLP